MSDRKPISKGLRFEVFKRDDFTCQYCGAHPPEVVLHVDHITPVKLGGSNDIENLLTACAPCNLGKSARPLTATPKPLADKAAEMAEREAQIAGYAVALEEMHQRVENGAWRVAERLQPGAEAGYSTDKINGIRHFVKRVGVHAVLDAADTANLRYPYSKPRAFKYFCGICWRLVREADE
jgi:hypothetical protein